MFLTKGIKLHLWLKSSLFLKWDQRCLLPKWAGRPWWWGSSQSSGPWALGSPVYQEKVPLLEVEDRGLRLIQGANPGREQPSHIASDESSLPTSPLMSQHIHNRSLGRNPDCRVSVYCCASLPQGPSSSLSADSHAFSLWGRLLTLETHRRHLGKSVNNDNHRVVSKV